MTRLALFVCVLLGCGADRAQPSAPAEVGPDEGIAADTRTDAEPDLLAVQPSNHTLMIDSVTGGSESLTYQVVRDITDVTATSTFTLDDPALGTFAANVLTTNATLPFAGVGRTFVITAREGGRKGRAKLTIVRLRTTGDDKDLLFSSPHGVTPSPDKDLFKVEARADNGGAGADIRVVLKNDPANPAGVDARKLVRVRAMSEGFPKVSPPACDPGQATKDTDGDGTHDTFVASPTDRALCFDVRPVTNVSITAAESASFHRVLVDVVTSTGKTLQSRSIVVIVPATDPLPR